MNSLVDYLRSRPDARIAFEIAEHFASARVYLVGGAVRDFLSELPLKDLDFVVAGVPAAELEAFLHRKGDVALVGKAFGVFAFHPRGMHTQIDIALPRTERAIGDLGRYKDFEIVADHQLPIEEDVARRDFTINAMAVDVRTGELIDAHGGIADLHQRRLRAVGDPARRFAEDRTRVLRGIRFAVCLELEIETSTWQAMTEISLGLEESTPIIPREVLAKELVKMCTGDAAQAIELLDRAGLLKQLFPEVEQMKDTAQSPDYHSEGNVFAHALLALKRLKSPEFVKRFGAGTRSLELPFAVLFHDSGKPETRRSAPRPGAPDHISFHGHAGRGAEIARRALDRMRFASVENFDVEKVEWLVAHHMFAITNVLATVKKTTLEAYFLQKPEWGTDLLRLIFLDLSGSLRPHDAPPDLSLLDELESQIADLRTLIPAEFTQIPHLVTGDDLMRELHMKSGPMIGGLLGQIRELQLRRQLHTREEAIAYARTKQSGAHD